MAVFRINKNKDYTIMGKYHLREKNMSLKAKGLLSVMLSLPDDWDYSVEGLVSICEESKTSIQAILKELEDNKYLVRKRLQNDKGQFIYEYNIYEKPYTEEPWMDYPCTGYPCTDNKSQLNNNKLNTKELNTNINIEEIDNNKLLSKKKEEKNQKYEELVNKLIEVYNSYDVFPKVIAVTKKRKQKINSRLKDVGYDRLIDAFAIASKSDFLTGKNDNNWKADFDWFVENDTNCIKVLENKYSNKQARTIYETI